MGIQRGICAHEASCKEVFTSPAVDPLIDETDEYPEAGYVSSTCSDEEHGDETIGKSGKVHGE